jgi:hypothetical protein
MSDTWPTELFDEDEWADETKKPDALYLPGGVMYLNLFSDNPVCLGEFGETEIVPKRKEETE